MNITKKKVRMERDDEFRAFFQLLFQVLSFIIAFKDKGESWVSYVGNGWI